MRDVSQKFDVPVGSKRKRVVSHCENAHANGRPMRGSGRPKRRKAVRVDSETDDDVTLMDVDAHRDQWSGSDDSEPDSDREESCKLRLHPSSSDAYGEIADEFLINEASTRQLLRLRKDELVRLYVAAGLSDDTESVTKPQLADAIISARDDVASLPPSSPPGRGDGNSSDFSSDDGNIAGDEETDTGAKYTEASSLRRRVTVTGMSQITTRALKTRSLSLGQLTAHLCPVERTAVPEKKIELEVVTRLVHSDVTVLHPDQTLVDDGTHV
jgi:mitogen-activated protein kinase kinase kinase 13